MHKANNDLKWILETFMRTGRISTKGAKNQAVKDDLVNVVSIILRRFSSRQTLNKAASWSIKQENKNSTVKLARLGK